MEESTSLLNGIEDVTCDDDNNNAFPLSDSPKDTTIQFGDAMKDGKLTESSGRVFDLRKAIFYKNQVGRLLTAEEMKMFEINW